MMKRVLTTILMLLAASTALAGQFTDGLGRSLSLPVTPQRIVSLAPALTELLYALQIDDRLVGVTRQCDYPPKVDQVAHVGEYGMPSLEAVVMTNPDLVLMDAAGGSPRLSEQLHAVGIPVYVVTPKGIKSTITMIRQVGAIVGAPVRAERLADRMEQQLRTTASLTVPVRVVFCVSLQPLVVAAPNTLPGEMLSRLGALNVVPLTSRRYPQWSAEALIEADPEIILVADMVAGTTVDSFFERLPVLQAVQNRRVFTLNPDLVFRPGPRLGQGLQQLGQALHQGGIQ